MSLSQAVGRTGRSSIGAQRGQRWGRETEKGVSEKGEKGVGGGGRHREGRREKGEGGRLSERGEKGGWGET